MCFAQRPNRLGGCYNSSFKKLAGIKIRSVENTNIANSFGKVLNLMFDDPIPLLYTDL
ncbi:MAG: hypothetical protein AB4057_19515 [Crocosphaera sp.]